MRMSQLYAPTLKEHPAEAEIASHRLLLRAGMIRKVAAGIYTWLPLGLAVLQKVERIVREEMNAIGAQEVLMPALQPAELWRQTGRWDQYGPEMMRLQDRAGRWMGLGPTHEELITDLVRGELRSYKQLPATLYQIQVKFRDEIRPRFGLMRAREFMMKDAYAFCASEEQVHESYADMRVAYSRVIERCGLEFKIVEAESGLIGGDINQEFMVIADTGEEGIAYCTGCGYAANIELATRRVPAGAKEPAKCPPAEKVHTPGRRSIEEVSDFLGVEASRIVKTLVYATDDGLVAVMVPGDREVSGTKLEHLIGEAQLLPETAFQGYGLVCGYMGPECLAEKKIRSIADESLKDECDLVAGANEEDYHVAHLAFGRDFRPGEYADLTLVRGGDSCPRCPGELKTARGIEVGHIFELGTKYSKAMDATFLDEDGVAKPFEMGCYGIGVSRMVAAAIEQRHDEKGIIWPISLAPFEAQVVVVKPSEEVQASLGLRLYEGLKGAGLDVLLDDRSESPGRKFADSELIGVPIQLIVGKKASDGVVELRLRSDLVSRDLREDDVVEEVSRLARDLWSEVEPRTSHRD
ncbi:MAG: proline--tRNA ligase [Actinobacteria bacterium]|nr:MAG: proline--tRNA ligase [Actinomycetota bacterium]